jgi:hypothetical protein
MFPVPLDFGTQARRGQQQARAGGRRLHEEVEVSHGRPRGRAAVQQCLDHCAQCRTQPPQGLDVRKVSTRYACSLDPPPRLRVAIGRQEVARGRRPGSRGGVDEVHGDNRFADHSKAPAASAGPATMSQHHDYIGLHGTSIDRPWPGRIVKTDGIAEMAPSGRWVSRLAGGKHHHSFGYRSIRARHTRPRTPRGAWGWAT